MLLRNPLGRESVCMADTLFYFDNKEGDLMNHLGTIYLETERLILRRFTESDIVEAYNNWTSDERVTEFLRWPTHISVDVTKSVLMDWISAYDHADFYQWAIVPKDIGVPIGTIGVVEQNDHLDIAHIGYCIGSRWWNQGFTSEALSSIISFLFEQVKVNRIESQHDLNNPNSGKVMMKCGLIYEGTLRQSDFNNKGIVDAAMYSILANEYNKKR